MDAASDLHIFKQSFVDVPIDADYGNAIATTEFLDASESLTTIFDKLGSVAFSPVKSDLLGNVKKIRERQLAAPLESGNLQDLCRNEVKSNQRTATDGLLWLVRGLEFVCVALSQSLHNPSEELSASFRTAYSRTLKAHHSFLVKPIFSAAMSAVPYRERFYKTLGSDQTQVVTQMMAYIEALRNIVDILQPFLATEVRPK